MKELTPERRRRLIFRALPVTAGVAVMALVAGIVVGGSAPSEGELTARDYARAWERQDWAAMYRLLDPDSRRGTTRAEFRAVYRRSADVATLTSVQVEDPDGEHDGAVDVPVRLGTQVFGRLQRTLAVPVRGERVVWSPALAFPGLRPGQRLRRTTDLPERASLLARDGEVLAEGPSNARSSPLGALATSIAGRLEPEDTPKDREFLYRRGFPRDTLVGRNGLELVFEQQLAGRPGGQLIAGDRVIARADVREARPVRTTIDTGLQETAVAALGGRLGGIAAIDPRSGEIRALAGIAFSAPQPPGSTFKIVTATAALEAGAVRLRTRFPVVDATELDGVRLENNNGEFCGGTFRSSFAHSCNSVFAPLGVKIGAARIVDAARRYGWNTAPSVPGEVPSTLPPADEIVSALQIGSTAIGQDRVLATPLRLASVAQVVASGGVRREPTLAAGRTPETARVTSRAVARRLTRMMVDVVAYGTGTAAAIEGVRVAGKTGTAELEADPADPDATEPPVEDDTDTDAWFTAFAPASRPRIALAVMLVRAGTGGGTAAPVARAVLEKALKG